MILKNIIAALTLAFAASGTAQAAPVFEDNFDSYTLATNTTAFGGNWTVTNGTVDVIGTGFFDFYPGNGKYIDLDGSSSNAGLFSTKSLTLNAGDYTVQFSLGGSTRGDTNSVVVNFGSYSETFTLGSASPLTVYTRTVSFASAGNAFLSFENSGGDNLGIILDNVSISAVPEPETFAMMLSGIGLMGFAASRRRKSA